MEVKRIDISMVVRLISEGMSGVIDDLSDASNALWKARDNNFIQRLRMSGKAEELYNAIEEFTSDLPYGGSDDEDEIFSSRLGSCQVNRSKVLVLNSDGTYHKLVVDHCEDADVTLRGVLHIVLCTPTLGEVVEVSKTYLCDLRDLRKHYAQEDDDAKRNAELEAERNAELELEA